MATSNPQYPPSQPAPAGIKAQLIDFPKLSKGLGQCYPHHFALVIDNCFTQEESDFLISLAETDKAGWQVALVNVGGGMQVSALDIRNSGRIIRDDFDMADFIFERVKPFLDEVRVIGREDTKWPTILNSVNNRRKGEQMRDEKWEMVRLNERMRFLLYGPGQYFEPHCDGAFSTRQTHPEEPEQRTFLTLQIYLRSSDDLKGGPTRIFSHFNDSDFYDVEPVPGRVFIFQHRHILHSGHPVSQGEKIALRSDILYRKIAE